MKHFLFTLPLLFIISYTQAQNVGIGVEAPQSKLSVLGDLRVDYTGSAQTIMAPLNVEGGTTGGGDGVVVSSNSVSKSGIPTVIWSDTYTVTKPFNDGDTVEVSMVVSNGSVMARIKPASGGAWTTIGSAFTSAVPSVFDYVVPGNGDYDIEYSYTINPVFIGFPINAYTFQSCSFLTSANGDMPAQFTALYVDSSGKVGVGTDAPESALHVNGNIQIADGSQDAGRILASDANGVASWIDPQTITLDAPAVIVDADEDTKIQLEESPDEDVIRFDLGGTEYFRMVQGRLEVVNASDNIAIGYRNLSQNVSGVSSTAIGSQAMHFNTSGSSNTAVGTAALYANMIGSNNVALGTAALAYNSNGNWNTAIGSSAMQWSSGGSENIGIGGHALENNSSGSDNVAIGDSAMQTPVNVSSSVAVGAQAGNGMYMGSRNTAIGFGANVINQAHNSTAIGANALVVQDSSLVLGNAAKVGIGTSAPQADLHVVGDVLVQGVVQIADSTAAAGRVLTSDANGRASWQSLIHPAQGWLVAADTMYSAADSTVTVRDGKMGLGTTSPSSALEVAGQVTITGGSPGAGKFLTSDANGLASWQDFDLADADGDTRLQVEESADEDKIRFDVAGLEAMVLDSTGHLGIGSVSPVARLQVGPTPNWQLLMNSLPEPDGVAALFNATTNNGGLTPASPETVLILSRDKVVGQSITNLALFDLSYTAPSLPGGATSRMDIRLSAATPELDNSPVVMTLRSPGHVGIGTTLPRFPLEVQSHGPAITVKSPTASGSAFNQWYNHDESVRGLIGVDGTGFSGAPDQFSIGTWTDHDIAFFTDGFQWMTLTADPGFVGIHTTNPLHPLEVNGSAAKSVGGTTWAISSDLRLKENVQAYEKGLAEILQINPIYFSYTEESGLLNPEDGRRTVGIAAQELQQVIPEAITEKAMTLEDGTVMHDALQLTQADAMWFALLNAVKEQQEMIKQLTIDNEKMKIENTELGSLVSEISRELEELAKLKAEVLAIKSALEVQN